MQVKTFFPRCAPSAWLSPTVVVVFPFAQRRRRDRGHDDVLAVRRVLQAVANRKMDLGFGLAVEFQFVGQNAGFGGDLVDRKRRRGLCDFDIAGHGRKEVL